MSLRCICQCCIGPSSGVWLDRSPRMIIYSIAAAAVCNQLAVNSATWVRCFPPTAVVHSSQARHPGAYKQIRNCCTPLHQDLHVAAVHYRASLGLRVIWYMSHKHAPLCSCPASCHVMSAVSLLALNHHQHQSQPLVSIIKHKRCCSGLMCQDMMKSRVMLGTLH